MLGFRDRILKVTMQVIFMVILPAKVRKVMAVMVMKKNAAMVMKLMAVIVMK